MFDLQGWFVGDSEEHSQMARTKKLAVVENILQGKAFVKYCSSRGRYEEKGGRVREN